MYRGAQAAATRRRKEARRPLQGQRWPLERTSMSARMLATQSAGCLLVCAIALAKNSTTSASITPVTS
jgi:hypothetical protein